MPRIGHQLVASLLLIAIGLPGSLGVGLHALMPHGADEGDHLQLCDCCHSCDAAGESEQPTVATSHHCLVCKFLATTKGSRFHAHSDLVCGPAIVERLSHASIPCVTSYALPISARGPPA